MTNKSRTIIEVALGVIILALLRLLIYSFSRTPEPVIVERVDTIKVDTGRIVEKTQIQYVTLFDTIYTAVRDTDTIQVAIELPIEHKLYKDTIETDSTALELEIEFSGFKPSLDRVGAIVHTTYEKVPEVKKRGFSRFVGVGAHVGVGTGYDIIEKRPVFGPEVGVGVTIGWGYTW